MFRKDYVLFQGASEVDAITKLFIKIFVKSLSLNFALFLHDLNILNLF